LMPDRAERRGPVDFTSNSHRKLLHRNLSAPGKRQRILDFAFPGCQST
jgi:hypothetical protein